MDEAIRTLKKIGSETYLMLKFAVWQWEQKTTDRQFTSDKAEKLNKNGIVTIPNYIEDDKCEKFKSEIEDLIENEATTDDEKVIAVRGDEISNIDSDDKSVIHIREGHDGEESYDTGMIDIRNVDKMLTDLTQIRDDPVISDIIEEASRNMFTPELRAYVNQSVTNTRDYHADLTSKNPNYKAFIYLTDVPDDSFGPYSYVPGSQQSVIYRFVNKVYNAINDYPSSDMRLFFESDAQNMTAPKGTLIISNQNGVHRGIPQVENKERFVLVNTYIPEPED